MFTGLISDLGTVAALDSEDAGATLAIATPLAAELGEGDSVAVDGVCLTAWRLTQEGFSAQAMRETLKRSSLGELRPGSRVNLELALRACDRLGGHIVQGHVDGVGTVSGVREDGFARVVTLEPPEALLRYIVEQGSVAVQGVSLTVSELQDGGFSVALIPETLARTNLGTLHVGSRVNLEADMLAKHVERLMEARA